MHYPYQKGSSITPKICTMKIEHDLENTLVDILGDKGAKISQQCCITFSKAELQKLNDPSRPSVRIFWVETHENARMFILMQSGETECPGSDQDRVMYAILPDDIEPLCPPICS